MDDRISVWTTPGNTVSHKRIISIAAVILLIGACSADTGDSDRSEPRTVRVLVEPLELDNTRTRVEAVGTSRAIRSIELHPAASGEVDAVRFEPRQRVQQGRCTGRTGQS